ncbi:hypothetical protein ACFSJ3_12670 [Corallincola platygyrae]|uniref:Uncharacterized protein n=1 Tax=Corallincola platygyrae TaxID=1193278 RepID=A0ABW4XP03_9GAMM
MKEQTTKALLKVKSLYVKHPDSTALLSIINQLEFIEQKSKNGLNPKEELPPGTLFTFGITSSRELASPEELKVKKLIDRVSELLDD